MNFDDSRAILRRPDWFKRFRVKGSGLPLREAQLGPDTQLIVAQRGSARLAFLRLQMVYHHVAEGELDNQPFVVTF